MTAFDQSAFLQALGWAVLNSLWQMALLWIVFHLIVSLTGSVKPSQKSNIAASLFYSVVLAGSFLFSFYPYQ